MLLTEKRSDARSWTMDQNGARVALVPTMGALHPGHLSLIEIARASADLVALSIFVNPLQFGPSEDLQRYPRNLAGDMALAEAAGVDMIFAPSAAEMYPDGEPWITVVPERAVDLLDGASRPGHFRGVLTVVAKLFGIIRPDSAIFGQKDLQQLTLIRRMAADLDFGVEIIAAPTVRDPDGLALSSRNQYLSAEERQRALALPAALGDCQRLFSLGETRPGAYIEAMQKRMDSADRIEYADVVDPQTLERVAQVGPGAICAVAARIGNTRLIDNAVLGARLHPA